jgi:hypothetical protein
MKLGISDKTLIMAIKPILIIAKPSPAIGIHAILKKENFRLKHIQILNAAMKILLNNK